MQELTAAVGLPRQSRWHLACKSDTLTAYLQLGQMQCETHSTRSGKITVKKGGRYICSCSSADAGWAAAIINRQPVLVTYSCACQMPVTNVVLVCCNCYISHHSPKLVPGGGMGRLPWVSTSRVFCQIRRPKVSLTHCMICTTHANTASWFSCALKLWKG